MMEEFRMREERIAKLEKEKDELHAKLSYATADPEDVDACDYELEDLVKSIWAVRIRCSACVIILWAANLINISDHIKL